VDFRDGPAEAAFRAEARAWLEANAPARGSAGDFSREQVLRSSDDPLAARATLLAESRRWQRRLAEGGWAGISLPRAWGGRGGTVLEELVFDEEQARFGVSNRALSVGLGMVAPTLARHGTDRQRRRYLPPLLRADEVWCQLFSEPDAGSDLASLTTTAERVDGGWVVYGQKVWSSGAAQADLGILLARTDRQAPRHRGIGYFLLDMAAPGVEVQPLRQMTGASHFNQVFLTGVRLPDDALVGGPTEGWRIATSTLSYERSLIGGVRWAAAGSLAELARARGCSGNPLVRQWLADAYCRERVLRFLGYRVRTAIARGEAPGATASALKLGYAEHVRRTTAAALAVEGPAGALAGAGAPEGGLWQVLWLDSPSLRIAGGTDEVQRTIIGERLLGLPREPR
jgi:alkylation response protein AidB-like acyl-CoA dehydrogenase